MGAADPTYPLFPISCIISAVMLLLVLLTSFVRQSWNLGVAFLCFWLFLENISLAVNTIIWSDNADIKDYVYCDIVSHLHMITFVVKPMATLIITRRIYLIASLQSVDFCGRAARRRNLIIEWTLGLLVPILVAGPIYYINQGARFQVDESFGCSNSPETSMVELLTIESWAIIPPLVSVCFYYPKAIRILYRQSRDAHSFLNSNTSLSRINYLRILALASVDTMLTLPVGIANVVLSVTSAMAQEPFVFYWGWTILHTDWEPTSAPYADMKAFGPAVLVRLYFLRWTTPVLAFAMFGLFGVTSEARASYWRIVCTVGDWMGWSTSPRARNGRTSLGEIEFGARPQDMSIGDVEMGPESRRRSFVTAEAPPAKQNTENPSGDSGPSASESKSIKKGYRSSGDTGEIVYRESVGPETIGAAV